MYHVRRYHNRGLLGGRKQAAGGSRVARRYLMPAHSALSRSCLFKRADWPASYPVESGTSSNKLPEPNQVSHAI